MRRKAVKKSLMNGGGDEWAVEKCYPGELLVEPWNRALDQVSISFELPPATSFLLASVSRELAGFHSLSRPGIILNRVGLF